MCLRLKVNLSEDDAPRAEEIARLASQTSGLAVCTDKSLFKRRTATLQLAEKERSCGCSLLTENADWNAATWDMTQASRPRLTQTLRVLRMNATLGFVFEALWEGEKPDQEKKVSIDELAAIVESGTIGTKTKYLVS